MKMAIQIQPFFDDSSQTFSYVVCERKTSTCIVIDPVLDFDLPTGIVKYTGADKIADFIREQSLDLKYILETHVHADHLSSAQYLKTQLGGLIGIGSKVNAVQKQFGPTFNKSEAFKTDGSQFDLLLDEGQTLECGSMQIRVLHTPGHTPACVTFVIDEHAFVGDTLFMPDYGTARTDFPGGDAATLFDSIGKILSLPDSTQLYMCHDYLPPGRSDFQYKTTVEEQKRSNIHLCSANRHEFVSSRNQRDKTLKAPLLLLPAIQVNIEAGELPEPEKNDVRYLKIPLR